MAMIDYGAIVWKDGKLISTDMFTEMKDMVGWDDEGEHRLKGNYFAYIGDKDLTIGFYKSIMRIHPYPFNNDEESVYFGWEKFEGWKRWEDGIWVDNDKENVYVTVRKRKFHDYYICKMNYRGHKYKVAFGYGVDLGYYKKTHIIDYYGTPWHRLSSWWCWKKENVLYWWTNTKMYLKYRFNKEGEE